MASKRKIIGRRNKTAKFRKQNKTKVRKSVKLTKSKRHNKKRKHKTKRIQQKGGVENECGICGEIGDILDDNGNIIDDLITLNCGHQFHRSEIIRWCQTKRPGRCTCPIDRENISQQMAQYMPASNNPNPNPNYLSNSDDEISEISDVERLNFFLGVTMFLLNNSVDVPLPEVPYLEGAVLPESREGGPKERIKNLLLGLFSNDNYFYNNFEFFINCSDIGIDMQINEDEEEDIARLKIALISTMMSLINDNLTYSDAQLRGIIVHFLERCAANALRLDIIPPESQVTS
jgi:hypothetical protein